MATVWGSGSVGFNQQRGRIVVKRLAPIGLLNGHQKNHNFSCATTNTMQAGDIALSKLPPAAIPEELTSYI